MILATVGTAQQPFNRLVKVVDELAAQMNEKVIIQMGTATYIPQHAESFRWASFHEMENFTQESRVVISQASVGAIILAVRYEKPLIVVPRLSKYGENFNDHQTQLAQALQNNEQAVLVEPLTVAGLHKAIDHIFDHKPIRSSREDLVKGLKDQLNAWQRQQKSRKNGSECAK